jgi:SAM-dependent methyltransferase
MSLPSLGLQLIRMMAERTPPSGPRRAISFGYPDILASEEQLFELFGNEVSRQLRFRPDSQAILKWHSATEHAERIVESRHFFSLIGYELTIADIARIRGDELLVDLNESLEPVLASQPFDLVIDGGTAEHCFNIGQAFKNMAEVVKVGGYILHINPAAMFNHGFYNLNPTLYADFYGENGFTVLFLKAVANMVTAPQLIDVPPVQRIKELPIDASIVCVAQRASQQPVRWPMQAKYRFNPTQTAGSRT